MVMFTCSSKCELNTLAACSFDYVRYTSRRPAARSQIVASSKRSDSSQDVEKPNPGLALKAVWYGAEQFGNFIGATNKARSKPRSAAQQQEMTREEVIAKLKQDYDKNYFISGVGDMDAYEEDCLFADPFTGFRGVARFKKNVSNLGGLLEDVQLEIYDWQEGEDQLATKWRFSGILQLPWRPRLAAAGGTTHVFSRGTGKVVKHLEEWDTEPVKVLRTLLKPSARRPSNTWDAFFSAVYKGDAGAAFQAVSGGALKVSAAVGIVLLLIDRLTPSEHGWALRSAEVLNATIFLSATAALLLKSDRQGS